MQSIIYCSSCDSYLYLYDRFGQRLLQNNNGGGGQNAQIRYTPQDNQPLMLEASTFISNTLGDYQLSVKTADDEEIVAPISILSTAGSPLTNIFTFELPDNPVHDLH